MKDIIEFIGGFLIGLLIVFIVRYIQLHDGKDR